MFFASKTSEANCRILETRLLRSSRRGSIAHTMSLMEISSDPGAHLLQFEQSHDAITVEVIAGRTDKQSSERHGPPSLPDWWEDCKGESCWRLARNALGIQSPHQEAITTW